ncbi:MAG TPA: DegV family protein [Eubacteriales bacterium]|nr:DegV family protein [Eubacteriales bacterium]
MNDFVIIPDSSCDLNSELRERCGIPDYLKGVLYYPDGREAKSDLDWDLMTPEQYYSSMKESRTTYRTATCTIGETVETFEKYLAQGKDVLSVSLSSALSACYQNALVAAKQLKDKYPGRRVVCVDSLRYSTSLALLIMLATKKKEEGQSIDEVAAWMNENRYRIHQMGWMDDLFFLCKTGRVSNVKALFGTLIGVSPMADFNREGLSEVLGKAKGKRSAVDATIAYMERTITEPKEQTIFIAHSNRPDWAETLRGRVQQAFEPKEIILNPVGLACGATVGPGLCAAFYFGSPTSEGLVNEKAIMTEILSQVKKG